MLSGTGGSIGNKGGREGERERVKGGGRDNEKHGKGAMKGKFRWKGRGEKVTFR